jgi:hypothetical protein
MRIEIKQEHIDKGIKSNCERCPVALALKDATGKTYTVGYEAEVVSWDGGESLLIPKDARDFAWHFDHGNPVIPFVFEAKPAPKYWE